MKMFPLGCFAILAALMSATEAQNEPAKKASRFRDAATHDSLVAKKARDVDPIKSLEPSTTSEDPSVKQAPVNLLDQSDIICFQGLATLVPKRAILFIPPQYKSRCTFEKGSKLVPWTEFFVKNRGWITTVDVTEEHMLGKKAIDEKTQEQMLKGSNIVVATFQNGPISVLPPKKEEAATATPKN